MYKITLKIGALRGERPRLLLPGSYKIPAGHPTTAPLGPPAPPFPPGRGLAFEVKPV